MGENLQGSRYKIVLCSNKQYSITRELHKVHTLKLGTFRSAHARTHSNLCDTTACRLVYSIEILGYTNEDPETGVRLPVGGKNFYSPLCQNR